MAESTLRKYLSVLKDVLEDFDLTLNLSPLEILGDEVNIRYFYFHFFEQVAEYNQHSYLKSIHMDLYAILRNLLHNYGLVLNVDYHRFVRWMTVSEQRIRQQKLVYLDAHILEEYRHRDTFLMLKTAAKKQYTQIHLI
ncbi:helix-turn-helix domain-containing protein [Enterococcus termitis]